QVVPILLHLHIPKTAGTTLNDCIYEQYASGPKTLPQNRAGRGWLCEGVFYYPGNGPVASRVGIGVTRSPAF
ncbi:MAG: hypothetical protein WB689_30195, partial [Xanthobacteraceae bacterium]